MTCDLVSGNPSTEVTIVPSLIPINLVEEDNMINMTELDHMIKETCDTVGWGALTWVNILPGLVVVDSVEVDI